MDEVSIHHNIKSLTTSLHALYFGDRMVHTQIYVRRTQYVPR